MSCELHFFAIPALNSRAAQDALNRFLAQHRVLSVEKQWLEAGVNSHWALCLGVDTGVGPLPDALKVGGGLAGSIAARCCRRKILPFSPPCAACARS